MLPRLGILRYDPPRPPIFGLLACKLPGLFAAIIDNAAADVVFLLLHL